MGGLRPETVTGRITFEDVRFHYPARPDVPILKGLDLVFEAGSTSALVGASGSGKSTIVSLVERFYDPISGVVKLDGVNVKDLNIKWLRSQIGLVSQEPTLFGTSIKENVAQGLVGTVLEHVDEEKKAELVKAACIKANADSFVTKLPNGRSALIRLLVLDTKPITLSVQAMTLWLANEVSSYLVARYVFCVLSSYVWNDFIFIIP